MRFLRLFWVVSLVTLCGGVFGAAVGGLTGFATPSALEVIFNVEVAGNTPDQDVQRFKDSSDADTRVHLAASGDRSLAAYGAALGASFGLILGAIFGIGIGLLDQLIIAFRHRCPAPIPRAKESTTDV